MKYNGFTLIEILIVIAIIAVLMVVLVPNLIAARSRGYQVAIDSCGVAITYAQQLYEMDNQAFSSSFSDLDSKVVRPCLSTGTLSIIDGPYSETEYWLVSSSVGGKARRVGATGISFD